MFAATGDKGVIYKITPDGKAAVFYKTNATHVMTLAFDKAGNLLVVSYAGNGTIFAMTPSAPGAPLQRLEPVAAAPRPGGIVVRPTGEWRVARDPASQLPIGKVFHYVSPDGSTVIPAGRDFVTGAMSWGVKGADLLRGFGLASAAPGRPFYVTSEAEVATWKGTLGPDGNFTKFEPFVQQGGESVAVDRLGNVYLAAGHVEVYDPAGRLIGTIEMPERPTQLVFGGKDGRTLFIAARSSLYSVRTK
jgi:sugar lactone lactonase YvrE